MPYAPGISYQGGDYLSRGISAFGQGIGGGIEEWKKKHDELVKNLGESDAIVEHAMKTGSMSADQYTKYLAGSETQKTGMAEGISKGMVLDQAERLKKMEFANAIQVAQIHAAAAQAGGAGGLGLTPEQYAEAQRQAGLVGKAFIQTSKGGGQIVDYPEESVDVSKLKAVPVPGTGPGTNIPLQTITVDDKGQPIKNAMIGGQVRPNPFQDYLMNQLTGGGGGGLGGGGTFNVAPATGAPAVAPLPAPDVPTPGAAQPTTAPPQPPKAGDVVRGYRFKGGNPADPKNWEQAQ